MVAKVAVDIGQKTTCEGNPLDVERRLVDHYLRTDGPGGAGPLRYIDADDAELAEAFGAPKAADALRILYEGCGGGDHIAHVLSDGWRSRWPDAAAPGFFRYLILTCAVVALADGDSTSQEFGHNLQRIFNTNRTFASRRALPGLWNALVRWCNSQRKKGEPIREFELPDRGPGIHIGITNAVSFPNWRDRRQLRNVLGRLGLTGRELTEPRDAARTLCLHIGEHFGHSAALSTAAREYYDLYLSQASLLYLHPFWSTVCRALDLARHKQVRKNLGVRITLEFAALVEDTGLSIAACDPIGEEIETSPPPYSAKIGEAIGRLARWGTDIPRAVRWREAFGKGAVAFAQEHFGVWLASEAAPATHSEWMYLVKASRLPDLSAAAPSSQRRIDATWALVGPLNNSDARRVHAALKLNHRDAREDAASDLHFEDGVRTPAGWLGRLAVLPRIHRPSRSYIELSACDAYADVHPRITKIESGWSAIEADRALDGVFRLRMEERLHGAVALALERKIRFTADAPEHPDLGVPTGQWREESECSEEAWADAPFSDYPLEDLYTEIVQRYDDFLELVYAGGRRGWAERDLVSAASLVLPGPSPWDVLRSLYEAGWLQRALSLSWRASRWWLAAPQLVRLSDEEDGPILVGGAIPAVLRHRFVSTVEALNGAVTIRNGIAPLSPLTVVATRTNWKKLAAELGWPVRPNRAARPVPAPGCWPHIEGDARRHQVYREWDWSSGRFVAPEVVRERAAIRLTWMRRPEGNRTDLYVVTGRSSKPLTASSRVVALAEAFRQMRLPMFDLREGALYRIPREGNLPLHLSRTLALETLRNAGPAFVGNAWTYCYPAPGNAIRIASSCLGRQIVSGRLEEGDAESLSHSFVIGVARHRRDRYTERFGARNGCGRFQ